jgi:hypothetical protein
LSSYPPHKARKANLIVGLALVIFSLAGFISVTANNTSGSNLTGLIAFLMLFVFMGGYEIGKYVEARLQKQWIRLYK